MKKFCEFATCLLVMSFVFICGVFAQDGNTEKSLVAGKCYEDTLGYKIEFSEEGNKFCYRSYREIYLGNYVLDGSDDKTVSYKLKYEKRVYPPIRWSIESSPPYYAPEIILASENSLIVNRFDYGRDDYKYVGDVEILKNTLAGTTQKDGKFVFTKNTVKVNAYENPIYDYEWSVDTLCYKISGYPPTDDIEKFLEYITTKASREVKTENENEMSYEQAFWIYMRTKYGENFLNNTDAQKLYLSAYHKNEYDEINNDQFAMYDRLKNINFEMKKKYDEHIPSNETMYSVRVSAVFTEYDFDKNQFLVKINIDELNDNVDIINNGEINYNEKIGIALSIADSMFSRKEQDYISTNFKIGMEKARELNKKTVLAVVNYKLTNEVTAKDNLRAKITGYELYDPETIVKIK